MAGRYAGTGAQPGERSVPPAVLRSWDEAEARLFPTCPDLPALLAAHERGGDLVADLVSESVAGVGPGPIAAAACAMRYRELVALLAARSRLTALARAREQGLSWTVVEESGLADRAPYVPYQRIEAEVESGRAVVASIGPDETLSRAVYRLDAGQIDLSSGALRIGEPVGSYLDPDEFAAALRQAQGGPAGAPGRG